MMAILPRILITGATGFVGQHLLDHIPRDKYRIRILTRNPLKKLWCSTKDVEVVEGDLADAGSVFNALKDVNVVINLAAELRDRSQFGLTNVKGVENLIAAYIQNKTDRIIHLSSVGVIGMPFSRVKIVLDEDSVCQPQEGYERTKHKAEQLLIAAEANGIIGLCIIRPTNLFGEHHSFNSLLNLLKFINSPFPVFYNKNAVVNYLYVKDLVAFIIKLLESPEIKGTYNLGSSCRNEEFFIQLGRSLGKPLKPLPVPSFLFNMLETINYFYIKKIGSKFRALSNKVEYSDQKAKAFFDYPYGLAKGMDNVVKYYKNNGLLK
ncbi:MAG: NAD-dependent epimerase/dehydratase family protein [Bacteroidetes bacterium]|nr:NAD-dependent epimerase/dehydratase family protein [Bacteroidota bacterium]